MWSARRRIISPAAYAPSGGGATTTTWNPSDKSASLTLSNGNLTATSTITTNAANVRSVANHASGKFYLEYTITAGNNAYDNGIGIANSTESLNTGIGSPGTNSTAAFQGDANIYIANTTAGTNTAAPAVGNIICMAVDIDNLKIYYRINGGNWNNNGSANPATNTGGLSFSAITGPYYAISTNGEFVSGPPAGLATTNFGASAYSFTAPAGFGNW